jgi:opacity protein-like surface antigen
VVIDKIKTFRLKKPEPPKPKKWWVGVQGGYGIKFLYNRVQMSPYVGIGVSYNLWSWWKWNTQLNYITKLTAEL